MATNDYEEDCDKCQLPPGYLRVPVLPLSPQARAWVDAGPVLPACPHHSGVKPQTLTELEGRLLAERAKPSFEFTFLGHVSIQLQRIVKRLAELRTVIEITADDRRQGVLFETYDETVSQCHAAAFFHQEALSTFGGKEPGSVMVDAQTLSRILDLAAFSNSISFRVHSDATHLVVAISDSGPYGEFSGSHCEQQYEIALVPWLTVNPIKGAALNDNPRDAVAYLSTKFLDTIACSFRSFSPLMKVEIGKVNQLGVDRLGVTLSPWNHNGKPGVCRGSTQLLSGVVDDGGNCYIPATPSSAKRTFASGYFPLRFLCPFIDTVSIQRVTIGVSGDGSMIMKYNTPVHGVLERNWVRVWLAGRPAVDGNNNAPGASVATK